MALYRKNKSSNLGSPSVSVRALSRGSSVAIANGNASSRIRGGYRTRSSDNSAQGFNFQNNKLVNPPRLSGGTKGRINVSKDKLLFTKNSMARPDF